MLMQLFQSVRFVRYVRDVDNMAHSVREASGRDALISAARQLFAEQGVDAVSLREVVRVAGHRNTNAVQYHFGDREALLSEVLDRYEREIGVRRTTLVDALSVETKPSARAIASALVRPSAAMLEHQEGRQHLQIVAELIVDIDRYAKATSADSGLQHWDELARSNMPETTFPLHRRYAAISLCFTELGRRAGSRRRPDHRLFVSDLIDLVAGVLEAIVSEETQRLLEERNSERAKRAQSKKQRGKIST